MSSPYVNVKTDLLMLDSEAAFAGLSEKEKLYAFYLYSASNLAAPIVARQRSAESFDIIKLFSLFFVSLTADKQADKQAASAAISKLPAELLVYVSQLFYNHSNYMGFGDCKFIPQLAEAEMEAVLSQSAVWGSYLQPLWLKVKDAMYSYQPQDRQIGCYPDGRNNYYSADMTKEEAEAEAVSTGDMSPYNTRIFRIGNKVITDNNSDDSVVDNNDSNSKKNKYAVYVASVDSGHGSLSVPFSVGADGKLVEDDKIHPTFIYGDHSEYLAHTVANLKQAINYASNDNQVKMLQSYIEAFQTGSTDAHIEGSKFWVQDKSPSVESYIGFIESYGDPLGVRGVSAAKGRFCGCG